MGVHGVTGGGVDPTSFGIEDPATDGDVTVVPTPPEPPAVTTTTSTSSVPIRRRAGEPGDMPDPTLPADAVGGFYAVYKSALYVGGVSATDPTQGQLGDCFLIATLSAMAKASPDSIRSLVQDHGDGTYTVRFKEKKDDGTLKDVAVKVDADLPMKSSAIADPYGPLGQLSLPGDPSDYRLMFGRSPDETAQGPELWPSIVEKAFAQWKGGYEAINQGGYLDTTILALTGHDAQRTYLKDAAADDVWKTLTTAGAQGRPATTSTFTKEARPTMDGLDPGHAYTVLGTAERNGQRFVQLRNPWGVHEPGDDGKDDGIFELTLDVYRREFDDLVVSTGAPPKPPEPYRDPFSGWPGGGGG